MNDLHARAAEPEMSRPDALRIPAQDAEDLLQDAVLVFWAKRDSIASPAPWLLATLRNRCLFYRRKRRRS
jgi:DNA-directed RNA polymerase specialized sigma24 family protein